MLVIKARRRRTQAAHLVQVPGAMFVGVGAAEEVVDVVVTEDDVVRVDVVDVVELVVPTHRTCPTSRSQFASSQGFSACSSAAVMPSLVSMRLQ